MFGPSGFFIEWEDLAFDIPKALSIQEENCRPKYSHHAAPQNEQPFSTFAFFPKLPIELRHMIWELSISDGRFIEIQWNHATGRYFTPGPAILGACKEARVRGLNRLSILAFPNNLILHDNREDEDKNLIVMNDPSFKDASFEKPFQTFVNWSQDTIYLNKRHMESSLSSPTWINTVNDNIPFQKVFERLLAWKGFIDNVQLLAVNPHDLDEVEVDLLTLISPRLQEISLILQKDTCFQTVPTSPHTNLLNLAACSSQSLLNEATEVKEELLSRMD